MSHACHRFWKCYKTLTFCSLLRRCTIPCACHAKRHLNLQKWSEPLVFLTFLTSKCAARHNSVHFFDISTAKSGPELVCFVHFDFEMCFVPQRRAIFHLSSGQLAPHRPTFRPSGATNHWKSTVFRDFPTFSRAWIFFLLLFSLLLSSPLLFLFSLTLSISAFHLSILSEVWLLNFLR